MRTTKFVLAAILLVSVTANPEDTDCTEGGQYLPSATDCSDVRSEATCSLMYQESLVFPGAVNERPYECFLGADGRLDQDLKQMAVENCPKTCGYCCLSKKDAAYNCTNSPNPQLPCNTVTASMCNDPQLRETIATDCPASCGFCGMGGCVDVELDCAKDPSVCTKPERKPYVEKNCRRTCGLCSNVSTTVTTPTTTSTSTTTSTTTTTPTPAVTDYDCTSGGRLLTSATDCSNELSDASCKAIYSFSVAAGSSADRRSSLCFMGADGRPHAALKQAALDTCPRTCGYCCKTKNAGVPVGGCVDTSPSCTKTFCVTIGMEDFVAKHCQRTCNLCYSRPTAAPPVISPTPAKIDKCQGHPDNQGCAGWVKNYDYCNNTFYTLEMKERDCPHICGLCGTNAAPTTPAKSDKCYRHPDDPNCATWVKLSNFCNNPLYSLAKKEEKCPHICGLC